MSASWAHVDAESVPGYYPAMTATTSDERRRVTMPPDLDPRSPVVIDTVIPGREWIVRVPESGKAASYSRGELKRDEHGFLVWSGDLGEDEGAALLRHRGHDDRAAE